MNFQAFEALVKSINYVITQVEIEDMFKYIDRNCSETIEITEIQQLLGY